MTQRDIDRAHLALFAAREAGPRGTLEQMQAIAMCMRNRVRQGWHDGEWMKVLENADDYRAHDPGPHFPLDADNRSFQRLIRDIDEIYFSRRDWDKEPSYDKMPSLDEAMGKCCYWAFIDGRPFRPWFEANIIKSRIHTQKAQMGLMLFYE